jgi:hypothetical protein
VPVFDDEEDESESEEEDDIEEEGPEGLDEMATPTSRPTVDIPGSSASLMLPPVSQTPTTPTPSGRTPKKRKRDTMSSIAKSIAKMQQTHAEALANLQLQAEINKQNSEIALAQMRVDLAKERMASIEMHKSNQEWMREESRANRELSMQNRDMLKLLMTKVNFKPAAALPPTAEAKVMEIKGQPSGSNISNASSPSQPQQIHPPLPAEEPLPVPPQPVENVIDEPSSSQDHGEDRLEDWRVDPTALEQIVDMETGQNLAIGASEVEPGSHDLPTEDHSAGSAH